MENQVSGNKNCPSRPALINFIAKLLFPLLRIALRYGLSVYEITEILRWVSVQLALQDPEFQIKDKRPTKARAAVLTGLSRREVNRLARIKNLDQIQVSARCNRAARILGAWLTNPEFRTPKGKPRPLPFNASQGRSFCELAQSYAGDVTPRAVLDELINTNSVRYEKDWVFVNDPFYIPPRGSDEFMEVATTSVSDFLNVIEHNLSPGIKQTYMQREVYSPRIPAEKVAEIESEIRNDSLKYLRSINRLLAEYSDHEKREGVVYKRIGLGMYYFEEISPTKSGPDRIDSQKKCDQYLVSTEKFLRG